jgi:hypothetical protein
MRGEVETWLCIIPPTGSKWWGAENEQIVGYPESDIKSGSCPLSLKVVFLATSILIVSENPFSGNYGTPLVR